MLLHGSIKPQNSVCKEDLSFTLWSCYTGAFFFRQGRIEICKFPLDKAHVVIIVEANAGKCHSFAWFCWFG